MTPCQRHFFNELGGLEPARALIFKATALVGSKPSVVVLQLETALSGSSAQPACFHGEGRFRGTRSPPPSPPPPPRTEQWPRARLLQETTGLPEVKEVPQPWPTWRLSTEDKPVEENTLNSERLKPSLSENRSKGQEKKKKKILVFGHIAFCRPSPLDHSPASCPRSDQKWG